MSKTTVTVGLATTLKAMLPAEMKKTAARCSDAAETLRMGANMLIEAGKAFDEGSFETGLAQLQEANELLDNK